MHETWLLPKSELLCMIRYQEDPPEDAHEDVQVPKFTEEENQRKEPRASPRPRTSGQGPGHPAKAPDIRPLERLPLQQPSRRRLQAPDIRPRQPRHPAPSEPPDIWPPARKSGPSEPESNKCHRSSLDIRPPSLDIRRRLNARTSGPTPGRPTSLSVHSKGPRPVYPFSPLDYMYSIPYNFLGLANV